ERLPVWHITERMAHHAAGVAEAADAIGQMEAVRKERMLLAMTNPVAPLRATLATELRRALDDVNQRRADAYLRGLATLEENAAWKQLKEADRSRILDEVRLLPAGPEDVGNDESLLAALDARN